MESNTTGHREKWISAIGGFASILAALWVSSLFLDMQGVALIVASMGASAVLLFEVPHGALSQPWQLVGGHFFSVIFGVACAQNIPDPLIAAPLAVGGAIGVMYYLRCLHPPGGATALSAVIGGASVQEMGFQYVLTPVMLNVAVMLLIALIWNNLFPWRRYPVYFKKQAMPESSAPQFPSKREAFIRLSHTDFEYARKEIGTYIDVAEQDLSRIYKLAVKHARHISDSDEPISVGNYYANGDFGEGWSVRKVVGVSGDTDSEDVIVTYVIVVGVGEGEESSATMAEFSGWQQYEVIFGNSEWHRILSV